MLLNNTSVHDFLNDTPFRHHVSFGGPQFMANNPWAAWPYIIIASSAALFGILGNSASLLAIYLNKSLRHSRNFFLINLAVADLIVTSFADPLSVVGMVLGSTFFDERKFLCDAVAAVCLGACVAALFSIGGMSFHQMLHIVYPDKFAKIFNPRMNIIICVGSWMVGVIMALPPLVGWTRNFYDPKYLECFWDRLYSTSYTVFFTVIVVFTPVIVISASFLKIYLHFRASKNRIAAVAGPDSKNSGKSDGSVKLARTLFIIFFVFVFCWAPIALLIVADLVDQAPLEVHLYILLLAHMHSSANPIVFAVTNKHYRDGYKMVGFWVFTCGRKKYIPGNKQINGSTTESTNTTGTT